MRKKTPWLYVQQGKHPPINIKISFTHVYLFTFMIFVWMVRKNLNYWLYPFHSYFTPMLYGKRLRQREELACSMIMISENATPRNS